MCDGASWVAAGMGIASLAVGTYSAVEQQNSISRANNQAQANAFAQMQSNNMDFMRQISQFQFQQQQLDKQYDYQNRMLEIARQSTEDAADLDYALMTKQAEQVNEEASLNTLERIRQGMRERARMRVASAESGLGGVSAERIQTNLLFQQGYDTALIEEDRSNKLDSISAQADRVNAEQEGRVNEVFGQGVNTGFSYTSKVFENYAGLMSSYKPVQSITEHSNLNPLLEGTKSVTSAASTGISTYASLKKK